MDAVNSLVFVTILLIVINSAYSLRCYNCTSTDPDRSCIDPIDINQVNSIECNPLQKETCLSLEAISMVTNDNRIISRKHCVLKNSEDICGFIRVTLPSTERLNVTACSSCDTDNCNAVPKPNWASSNSGPFTLIFGVIVLILSKIK